MLMEILNVSVGFNKAVKPWSNNNTKIINGEPKWVACGFYEQYKCIERMIILAARK